MEVTRTAELLYDSARIRERMGARSGICLDRTVLFRSPDLVVDVVVHASRDPLRTLHGQVIRQAGGVPVPGAIVQIQDGAASDTTDEFGQFAVSSLEEEERFVLRIEVHDHQVVCVIPTPEEVKSP